MDIKNDGGVVMESIDMCVIVSMLLVLTCWIAFVWAVNGRSFVRKILGHKWVRSFVCKILGHKWSVYEDRSKGYTSEWIKWNRCDRCGEDE